MADRLSQPQRRKRSQPTPDVTERVEVTIIAGKLTGLIYFQKTESDT